MSEAGASAPPRQLPLPFPITADRRGIITLAVLAGAVVFFAVGPLFLSGYWIRVLSSAFMMTVVTASMNLIVGFAGYPAFGNVVFFGVGAYTAGILAVHYNVPPPAAILAAGIVAALYAIVLGYPILRLRGGYFAIATLGINEATLQIVTNLTITGGAKGMTMPNFDLSPPVVYGIVYYFMFGVMLLCVGTVAYISRHPFGYALRALRDEEEAAKVMGINTTWYKTAAWAISAFFTSIVGAGWAYWLSYFEPRTAFDVMIAVKGFVMMLLGGMGTLIGPVIGAFFLEVLSELVWGSFVEYHRLVLGALIVFTIIALPNGLLAFGEKGSPIVVWRDRLLKWGGRR